MSAALVVNLSLLILVGVLLVWFPDRLTLVPLILSRVNRAPPGPAREEPPQAAGRPRPGRRPKTQKVGVTVGRKKRKTVTTPHQGTAENATQNLSDVP